MPACCGQIPAAIANTCDNWDPNERRNSIASVLSGILFFGGWWCIIDAAAQYPTNDIFPHAYHVCGVVATIAMFMINTVSNGQIRGDAYTEGCMGPMGARIWIFLGLVLSFGSVIAAGWILFGGYVITDFAQQGPGVAVFLQNIFIFFSSIIFKLGRVDEGTFS